jgi:hypothetical protein
MRFEVVWGKTLQQFSKKKKSSSSSSSQALNSIVSSSSFRQGPEHMPQMHYSL